MTKKLSELFELPDSESEKEINESNIEKAEAQVITQEAYSNLEKIENALPQVRGLEASDTEMDELASLATNSYKDLMDLGMQVDSRFASEIFNSASSMLGHAITAKTAKINKKLKMIDLQLKKASLDHKTQSKIEEIESTPLGEGNLLDRNELLKTLLANKKDNSDK
jgi:CRISPR/Cas system CMR-associated protein Cmr5 small subunit